MVFERGGEGRKEEREEMNATIDVLLGIQTVEGGPQASEPGAALGRRARRHALDVGGVGGHGVRKGEEEGGGREEREDGE